MTVGMIPGAADAGELVFQLAPLVLGIMHRPASPAVHQSALA